MRLDFANVLVSGSQLLGICTCGLTFCAWIFAARGSIGAGEVFFSFAFSYLCILAGTMLLEAVLGPACPGDFPTVFAFGFFFLSTAVFVLSLLSPLGMRTNGLLLLAAILTARLARPRASGHRESVWPALAACLISLIAGSLWSSDSIRPLIFVRGSVIVKPWADSFYHAAIVRMFRDAHGMGTLENVLLPGQAAPIYHYASYSIPALLCATADTPCYLSLTAFQVPLGIVLTGFAAFALAKSWWGPGAGLWAVIALLLPTLTPRFMGSRTRS